MKKFFNILLIALCAMMMFSCNKEDADGAITDASGHVKTPEAGFRYMQYPSFTVDFTNTSVDATSYKWDFGDGSTSTEVNPSHTYASIGTKYVTLTAYNGEKHSTVTAYVNMTSTIKMKNKSSHTYKVYVDGIDMGNIAGNGTKEYDVNPGNHSVRVLQQDGYVFYATDQTYTITCTAGYIEPKEFPDDLFGKSE